MIATLKQEQTRHSGSAVESHGAGATRAAANALGEAGGAAGNARIPWLISGVAPGQRVYSPEAFRTVVCCERARSDRNTHGFSIVAFDVGGNGDRPRRAQALIRLLEVRCRFTDGIGWVDEKLVGVILPYTNSDGARAFAETVRDSLTLSAPVPTHEVYAYPDDPALHGQGERKRESAQPAPALVPDAAAVENPPAAVGESIAPLLDRPCPFWKRAMDILIASAVLLLLSPLLLGLALFIRIVSPGPALFRQERVGYLGRRFTCWKFRTMRVDSDAASHEAYVKSLMRSGAPMTKLDVKADPRIIPLGTLLRQSGLDELPQLFNVLRGDMSLVGPRPCIPYEYEAFHRWQRTRVDARPGLTGLWQVSGKNRTTFEEMLRLDIRYARDLSPGLDLAIMLKTFRAIVMQLKDGSRAAACRAGKRQRGSTVGVPTQAFVGFHPIAKVKHAS